MFVMYWRLNGNVQGKNLVLMVCVCEGVCVCQVERERRAALGDVCVPSKQVSGRSAGSHRRVITH